MILSRIQKIEQFIGENDRDQSLLFAAQPDDEEST